MIIDAHIHVGAWNHADFLGRQVSLAQTLEVLEECQISGAALCPTDRYENQALIDDARAAIANGYSGKLWLFPWVQPVDETNSQCPGARDITFVEANRGDIRGIKVHPSLSRKRITDVAFAPILNLANRLGLVVLVHCGRWQEIASYRFAVEAAQRYPQAKFLLAHAGGDTPPLATAAADLVRESKTENVWFEFSGLREYWVIERNCGKIGAHRYLMGSDYGLAHPQMYIGAVSGMKLSAQEKDQILYGNALGLFGESLQGGTKI